MTGLKIFHSEEIDSTNEEAKRHIKNGTLPHGALFIADQQTKGRGRGDREWISQEGDLATTLVIKSTLPPDTLSATPLITGLALYRTLAPLAKAFDLALKWPNDLLLNSKKCAGILVESVNSFLLIGLGVNIALNPNHLPSALKRPATSLQAEGVLISREALLATFLNHFEPLWNQFEREGFSPFRAEYLLASRLLDGPLLLREDGPSGTHFTPGHALALDETGALRFKTETGETKTLYSGDVL